MGKWDIMAPHAKLVFTHSPGLENELNEIPGLKNKRGTWLVPLNAVKLVNELAAKHGAKLASASWAVPPLPAVSFAEAEAQLRSAGELNDWVYEFFTPYQREAIEFGWNKPGLHLWHPTGSGKTLSGLVLAASTPQKLPILVVTKGAARVQYGREIERFFDVKAHVIRPASQLKAVRVKGQSFAQFRRQLKGQGLLPAQMAQMWEQHKTEHGVDAHPDLKTYFAWCRENNQRPFVVVGWEALTMNLNYLTAVGYWGALVLDECHRGKNSKRWDVAHLPALPESLDEAAVQLGAHEKEARQRGGFVKQTEDGLKMFLPVESTAAAAATLSRMAVKRVCTTATPIKDRLRDLWAQLDLAEPNAWGNTTQWMTRYCDRKPGVYGGFDTTGSSNVAELKERMTTSTHILDYRATHASLPAKRRQSFYVPPDQQCAPAAGFSAELRSAQKRGAAAVLETRLAMAASQKRPAILSLLEDHIASKHKIVIFTGRRRDCTDLGVTLSKQPAVKASGAKVWAAHGEYSVETRQAIVDEYMAHPGPCVLVGTGDSFGESLNMHDTDAALFVMLPYTPGQLRQWEGRFCRLGQKRPVTIYYVIAENTVDEHVAGILIDKLPAVEKVAEDTELAEAKDVLAGKEDVTPDEFAAAILAVLDFEEDA